DGKLESATATIDIGSINTRNEKRDKHLRQPDFFDAEKHPSMTFTSTAISGKNGKGVITGDLTIRDITKSVELSYTLTGPVKDPYGNTKIGFEASGEIDRSAFGLTYSKALESGGLMIGNEVTLDINMEFAKK
ncbi:MAG: YceI family protein, partial [Kiritimatiellae bacterium]|nr:YceI family protein [Kiritimatiellia bacterium]